MIDWLMRSADEVSSDIAFRVPPQEIFKKLTEVWDIPLRRGCKVLALTVPDVVGDSKFKMRGDADRKVLNELIMGYKKPNLWVQSSTTFCCLT